MTFPEMIRRASGPSSLGTDESRSSSAAGYLADRISCWRYTPVVPWEVLISEEFELWWHDLTSYHQNALAARIAMLRDHGPALGRPTVDTIQGSKLANICPAPRKDEEERAMKRFEELEAQVVADAARREAVESERSKVVTEQVRAALGELRRVRQLTQVELSRTMQRPQSTISRIEREGDMLLSTLAAYVEALGGYLEINAIVAGERIALTAAPTNRRSA